MEAVDELKSAAPSPLEKNIAACARIGEVGVDRGIGRAGGSWGTSCGRRSGATRPGQSMNSIQAITEWDDGLEQQIGQRSSRLRDCG